jgi:hypothetical protein
MPAGAGAQMNHGHMIMVGDDALIPPYGCARNDELSRKAVKRSSEEQAQLLATKMADVSRKAAAATVNMAIGDKVLELLAAQETISLASLIGAFQSVIDALANHTGPNILAMQAEESIKVLRSLRASP